MILLDFFSGSHGHFLEYVINTWLFKGPRVDNIFTDLGSSHRKWHDYEYMTHRVVYANHYSEFLEAGIFGGEAKKSPPNKVIRISINNDWTNWIYQINVSARAGDIPHEKKIESIPHSVKTMPSEFRNQWYSKFNSSDGYHLPGNWRWPEISAFDFPMESLFDLVYFYNMLHDLAVFLETTFVPDQALGKLFEDFLLKNQGWQCYKKCKQLVDDSFKGNNTDFTSDNLSQALINSLLSKSVGIYDGQLFDSTNYPTNTAQVWDIIDLHLKTFDSRF